MQKVTVISPVTPCIYFMDLSNSGSSALKVALSLFTFRKRLCVNENDNGNKKIFL